MGNRLKFRVWDKENSKYLDFEGFKKGDIEFNFDTETNNICIEFDPIKYDVLQYTGLDDNKGNPIHHGDLCKHIKTKEIVCIRWYKHSAQYVTSDPENCFKFNEINNYNNCNELYEVIGNIYQDKELLNE